MIINSIISFQTLDKNQDFGVGGWMVGQICYTFASLIQTNFWKFFCYFCLVMELQTALDKLLDL